ncbi:MAG: glycosyltransferase [Pseudomonadales bacterium]
MNTIYLSVVIPLYNKASSIVATVESVLQQQYPYFELIIINDGSTDQSLERLKQIDDKRVRIISQENAGVAHARNTGISMASYPYIAFLDGDDAWDKLFLSDIVALIISFPNAGAYSTGYQYELADNQRKIATPNFTRKQKECAVFLYSFFETSYAGDLPIQASGCCIPKKVLDHVGVFPVGEAIGEDQDLWARIGLKYPMAFSQTVRSTYKLNVDDRACVGNIPAKECPFSKRLYRLTKTHNLSPKLRHNIRKYTANHILNLVKLNILAGRLDCASKLLHESRTWLLLPRKIKWSLQLWLAKFSNAIIH